MTSKRLAEKSKEDRRFKQHKPHFQLDSSSDWKLISQTKTLLYFPSLLHNGQSSLLLWDYENNFSVNTQRLSWSDSTLASHITMLRHVKVDNSSRFTNGCGNLTIQCQQVSLNIFCLYMCKGKYYTDTMVYILFKLNYHRIISQWPW